MSKNVGEASKLVPERQKSDNNGEENATPKNKNKNILSTEPLLDDLENDIIAEDEEGNKEADEEEEDELTQDWASFLKQANIIIPNNNTLAVVPKRGDKGYEPNKLNRLDDLILQNKRDVMYATISQPRGHFYKGHMEAFVLDDLSKFLISDRSSKADRNSHTNNSGAVIIRPKGSILNHLGYRNKKNNAFLNFEEILYLIERGSCQCYRYIEGLSNENNIIPLSLQLSYSCLLKSPGDHDWFFVYSYLKRYGFIVRRYQDYQFIKNFESNGGISLINKLIQFCCNFAEFSISSKIYDYISRFFNYKFSWYSFYDYLKIVDFQYSSKGKKTLLVNNSNHSDLSFRIVYNVWKPNTHVKIPQRGPLDSSNVPDFHLLIVNINKIRMPTLQDLNSLFDNDEVFYSRSSCLLLAIIDNGLLNFVKVEKGAIGRKNVYLKNLEKVKKRNSNSRSKKNKNKKSKQSDNKKSKQSDNKKSKRSDNKKKQ